MHEFNLCPCSLAIILIGCPVCSRRDKHAVCCFRALEENLMSGVQGSFYPFLAAKRDYMNG